MTEREFSPISQTEFIRKGWVPYYPRKSNAILKYDLDYIFFQITINYLLITFI